MHTTTPPSPTGLCWCDCGGVTRPGSFFLQGHDKRAERYLTAIDGNKTIADRLAERGFIPGMGRSLREETLKADPSYVACGLKLENGLPCRVIGKAAPMHRHRNAESQGHETQAA